VRKTILLLCCILTVATAADAKITKPIQLAFFNPLQIYNDNQSISGFRFSLIYGQNVDMKGLDLGLINVLTGELKGIEIGVANISEGNGVGGQLSLVNVMDEGYFRGAQIGAIYNTTKEMHGFQFGLFNKTHSMSGLQLGLVNWTYAADGLQIGLVNIMSGKEKLRFLPIVNWSF